MSSLSMLSCGGKKIPTLIGTSFVNTGVPSTQLIIDKPTGTVEGDLMVAFCCGSESGTWTGDTGWTEVADQGVEPSLRVAYKIATASEGSSYTFIFSSSKTTGGVILTYRFAAYDTVGSFAPDATPVVAPGISVAVNNSILLASFAVTTESTSFSTPTGFSVLLSDNDLNRPGLYVFSKLVSAGATGTVSSTDSPSGASTGILVSIKPT